MANIINQIDNIVRTTYENVGADAAEASLAAEEEGLNAVSASTQSLEPWLVKINGRMVDLNAVEDKVAVSARSAGQAFDYQRDILDRLVETSGAAYAASNEAWAAVQKQGQAERDAAGATDQGTNSLKENITQSRAARYAGLEVVGMLSLMSIAMGETLPDSARELEKSLMIVTSGALSAAMMGLNPILGAVAGGFLALIAATGSVDQNIQDLNKQLDTLAKKDEIVQTLASVTGASKESATALMEVAKSSTEAGIALRDLAKAQEALTPIEMLTTMIGQFTSKGVEGLRMLADLLPVASAGFDGLGGSINSAWTDLQNFVKASTGVDILGPQLALVASAQNQYTTKANAEAQKVADYNEKTGASIADTNQTYLDGMASAWTNYSDGVARTQQSLNDQLNQLAFSRAQQIIQDNERAATINQTYLDAQAKAAQDYTNKIVDADRKLSDQKADIARSTNEKLADLDYQYNQKLQDLNDQQVRNAYDLAYRLYQIERERTQRQDDIQYNLQQRSENAKTWNQYMQLVDDANRQTMVANRTANNQIEDANHTALDKQTQIENQKLQNFQDNYNQRRMIILRDAQDQIDSAVRANQEQRDNAERTLNEQLATATDTYKKQSDALAAEERRQEETYNNSVANAQRAYDRQLASLGENLAKQQELVKRRWDDEMTRLQRAEDKEAERHNLVMYNLELELEKAQQALGVETGALAGSLAAGAMYGFGGYRAEGGPVSGGTTYIVGDKGPELLTLSPGTSGNITPMGGGGLQFIIQGNVFGVEDLNSWFDYAVQKWNKQSMGYVN